MSYLVTERNARLMLTDALSYEFLVIYIQESLSTETHSYSGFNTAELLRGAANVCRCSREAGHMVRVLPTPVQSSPVLSCPTAGLLRTTQCKCRIVAWELGKAPVHSQLSTIRFCLYECTIGHVCCFALQLVYVNLLSALERVLRAAADEMGPVGDESSGVRSVATDAEPEPEPDAMFVDEAELEEALACLLALMPYRAGREAVRGSQKMLRGIVSFASFRFLSILSLSLSL